MLWLVLKIFCNVVHVLASKCFMYTEEKTKEMDVETEEKTKEMDVEMEIEA